MRTNTGRREVKLTPVAFRARSYHALMQRRYARMVDRWWEACIQGRFISPFSLSVMGIRESDLR